jgi:dTDP-4-dehydrorhamnose reductase
MPKKLLVIGARGLLGQTCVRHAAARGWVVVGVDVGEIDITNRDSVETVVAREAPAAVINCAAYTDVEGAETPEGRAIADRVNGDGPGILADVCVRHGSALIHVSTDYVFNGTTKEGARETDVPDEAMNTYGETKRAGEIGVIEDAGGLDGSNFRLSNPRLYLVRTSWLFGASAKNFVGKIADRARRDGKIAVVTDEVGSPTYVEDLAGRLLDLLDQNMRPGIYHLTGGGSCSRFEFAKAVIGGLGINAGVEPTMLAAFPRKARIANVSVLKNTKLPAMRTWEEMVESYTDSMASTDESISDSKA